MDSITNANPVGLRRSINKRRKKCQLSFSSHSLVVLCLLLCSCCDLCFAQRVCQDYAATSSGVGRQQKKGLRFTSQLGMFSSASQSDLGRTTRPK